MITFGVCPLTFPARAREPWTLPDKQNCIESSDHLFSFQTFICTYEMYPCIGVLVNWALNYPSSLEWYITQWDMDRTIQWYHVRLCEYLLWWSAYSLISPFYFKLNLMYHLGYIEYFYSFCSNIHGQQTTIMIQPTNILLPVLPEISKIAIKYNAHFKRKITYLPAFWLQCPGWTSH